MKSADYCNHHTSYTMSSQSNTMNYTAPFTAPFGDFTSEGTWDDSSVEMLSDMFQAVNRTPNGWTTLARDDVPGTRLCVHCRGAKTCAGTQCWCQNICRVCEGEGNMECGFMFDTHPDPSVAATIKQIDANIKYDGHSGSSYGWSIRSMESIAKRGWKSFMLRRRLSKLRDERHDREITMNHYRFLKDEEVKLNRMIRDTELEHKQDPMKTFMNHVRAVDSFISTTTPAVLSDLHHFADAIQSNPVMRATIPDIDDQADALRRFADGKLSYAEMRSLCG